MRETCSLLAHRSGLENKLGLKIIFVLYEGKMYSFHKRTEVVPEIVSYRFFQFRCRPL